MKIAAIIDFACAALNFAVMAWSIASGRSLWYINLGAGIFCFCMGLVCLKD